MRFFFPLTFRPLRIPNAIEVPRFDEQELSFPSALSCHDWCMDARKATVEEFAAEGYTHLEYFRPRCRVTGLRPIQWLPKISMGLTLAQLSVRLRCVKCGGSLQSLRPWRMEDVLCDPLG